MNHRHHLLTSLLLASTLVLGACGSSDSGADEPDTTVDAEASTGADTRAGAGADVEDALEAQSPDGRIEVPSADGAVTIADYAAGGIELDGAEDIAMVLSMVGTDATGYITDDTIVVERSEADATLLCGTIERLDVTAYRVVPVLPDGSGVDCEA